MKKITVLLVVLTIVVASLTACTSDEQRAADEFVDKLVGLLDEAELAFEEDDLDKLHEVYNELLEMYDQYQGIYDNLAEVDEEAAEEFEMKVKQLSDEFIEKVEKME